MSKDYVEELMNILDRDTDNGKFDDNESEFIIVDEDYDDNYDDDDCDDFIVIEDNSSNDEYSNDEWNDEFDNSLEEIQVIDTNYVPDYYEEDLFDEKYSEKEKDNGVTIFDLADDYDFNFDEKDLEKEKDNDVIVFGEDYDFNFNFDEKDKEIKNENTMLIQNTIDDRISKNIAKDIINSDVDMTLEEDDANDNWILDDMFGNDLSKMLVEEEHQENEEFSDGSFADWVK